MMRLDFDELDRRTKLAKRTRQTVSFLDGHGDREVARTLRAHWDDPIETDEEVKVRDRLDDLLEAVGMVEIATFLGVLSDWPEQLHADVDAILNEPNVRRYYEELYPIVLPQLMRDRPSGRLPLDYSQAEPGAAVNAQAVFIALFDLDIRRNNDKPLNAFLGLLDGYDDDGWFLNRALNQLRNPEIVLAALHEESRKQPKDKPSRTMRLLLGLDSFLTYGQDLLTLLTRNEGELVASLAWLHHSYFYGGSANSARRSLQCVQDLLRHFSDQDDPGQAAFAEERADAMLEVLAQLADYERWLGPAYEVGLQPYLRTLDALPRWQGQRPENEEA